MTDIEEADVVVIGSGMGGLAAARAIAQFGGRRVLVLEQHYTLGGMTHEFARAGQYRFGTGLHYMSMKAGPFLEFMTDGRAQLSPLPDDYDVLHFPGFDFAVPAGREQFRARLIEQFPDEAGAIGDFFRTTRLAMAGLAARNVLASMNIGTAIVRALFPSAYRSVWDQVSRSFRDPRLRAILAARWGLYGTPPRSSAFGYHAAVPLTFFMDGTAHPVGGPAELGRIVVEILQRYGVQLRPRQRVTEVLVERGRVTGVDVEDTADGRRYRVRAGAVVSAVGVRNTYALAARWRTVRAGRVARDPATPWQGYLRVVTVESLTSTVRRIRLEPLHGGDLPFTFTAGQYVKLELPVAAEPVVRSYSICSGPDRTAFLEIAVRREPDGLGSVFLHDEVDTGQALRVTGPHGEFTWNGGTEAETLLLIGGGVGITPLMSVLAAAADGGHAGRIVLLASFRAEDEVLFGAELAALRHRLPGLVVKFVVTEWYGRIGVEELRPYVDGNTRVHLCGPAPMMQDLIGHLTVLRVPREAIHTEAFVSASSGRTRRERAHAIALAAAADGLSAYTIEVAGTEPAFPCRPGQSVLDAANAAGVPLPQSCGEGSCGTCRVRVLAGAFQTDNPGMFSAAELAEGWLLACQTLPTGDMTISAGSDRLTTTESEASR